MRKSTFQLTLSLLFCAMAVRSQTATGSIVGTVTDSSGAAVASAKVTVTNASTNSKSEVISNAEGDFTAPLLPPGSYSIAVAAAGFKGLEQTGIRVQVQQQARIDVVLQVGALNESVQVTADAAVASSMAKLRSRPGPSTPEPARRSAVLLVGVPRRSNSRPSV